MAEAVVLVAPEGLSFWGRIGRSIRAAATWVKTHVVAAWSWTTKAVSTAAVATWTFTTKWASIAWTKALVGGRWVIALIPRTLGWIGFAVSSVVGFLVNALAWFFFGWGLIEFALFAVVILALAWVATRWDAYISGTLRWMGMKAPRQPYLEFIREYKAKADEKDGAIVTLVPEPEPEKVRWQDQVIHPDILAGKAVTGGEDISAGKRKRLVEKAGTMEARFWNAITEELNRNGQKAVLVFNPALDQFEIKMTAKPTFAIENVNFAEFITSDTVLLLEELIQKLLHRTDVHKTKSYLFGRLMALQEYQKNPATFLGSEAAVKGYATLIFNQHKGRGTSVKVGTDHFATTGEKVRKGVADMGMEIRDALAPAQ